ncbi:MAG: ACT domain-containing protein [Bacillota bacterium]|nr:ACT domain-containing protein [Bacillota bacterium]
MKVQQLSAFLQNEPGSLLRLTGLLEEAGVNISALSIAETEEYGVLRMIVSDNEKAAAALRKGGYSVRLTDVNCVVTPDVPGALCKALSLLAAKDINVSYMYGYSNAGKAYLIMKTNDAEETARILDGAEW